MKISIIGAGAIGSAVAIDLSERDGVDEVRVCDAGSRALKQLHQAVASKKVKSYQVDGRDVGALKPVVKDSDCLIGCADPHMNPQLAELSLELGMHFCDLGGGDEIVERELALNDAAQAKGRWILPNCGLAPGLINLLCFLGVEQFDEVDSAHLRVGDLPVTPEPPFDFRLSVSANKLIDDYTMPAYLIEKGEFREVDPLTQVEDIYFGEPFGRLEAFSTAGSISTLAPHFTGRVANLDMKTIRWPGHADRMRFLLGLGFGEKKMIDVRTHLTYNDVLVRRLQKRLGGEYADVVLLRAAITGTVGGEQKTLVYEMVDRYDDKRRLSAMRRCTSIPIASIAYLLASGAIPGGGAAPPETVAHKETLLAQLIKRGLDIRERWFDGWRSVTDPDGYHAA